MKTAPVLTRHMRNSIRVGNILASLTSDFSGTKRMYELLRKNAGTDCKYTIELALCKHTVYCHMLKMAVLQEINPKVPLYTVAQTLHDALTMVLSDIQDLGDAEPYIRMQELLSMVITEEMANAIQR